jgi:hypothetical protein
VNRLVQFLRNPEIIGPPDCPLMLRWTILDSEHPTTSTDSKREGASGVITDTTHALTLIKLPLWLTRDRKLMVHHFLPNVEERDFHDHPRPFWTLVLRGRYFDLTPCKNCHGVGHYNARWNPPGRLAASTKQIRCLMCQRGRKLNEEMSFGKLRFRSAEHTHITQAAPEGAWTLVWMLPLERKWGFWQGRVFLPWREYKDRYGFGMQCPTDEEREKAVAVWDR